jgi:hypothetical protein
MKTGYLRGPVATAILFLAALTAVRAASMLQFSLDDLIDRSDRIFRGTIIETIDGSVELGGAEIPTRTFRIQLDEPLKGIFSTPAGDSLVEIRMVRSDIYVRSGDAKFVSVLPRMPSLETGESYLLFTTRPSEFGLSATVGLGQGSFHITATAFGEELVNEFGNIGLFNGLENPDLPESGPVGYRDFTDLVRDGMEAN